MISDRIREVLGRAFGLPEDDEFLYELVVSELEAGVRRPGLWTKAVVSSTDERDAQRAYIRLRVEQLRPRAAQLRSLRVELAAIRAELAALSASRDTKDTRDSQVRIAGLEREREDIAKRLIAAGREYERLTILRVLGASALSLVGLVVCAALSSAASTAIIAAVGGGYLGWLVFRPKQLREAAQLVVHFADRYRECGEALARVTKAAERRTELDSTQARLEEQVAQILA